MSFKNVILYLVIGPAALLFTWPLIAWREGWPSDWRLSAAGIILLILGAIAVRAIDARGLRARGISIDDGIGAYLERSLAPTSDHRPHHAAPVLLQPVVPFSGPAAETSWIGGAPCLPEGVDWPTIDGRAALFLAQIDCRALPEGLWGGIGPREGWLCIFMDPNAAGTVRILHTHALGQPRQGGPRPRQWLKGAIGDRWWRDLDPACSPSVRWPVRIVPQDEPPQDAPKYLAAPNLRREFCETARLDDPCLTPFDWVSARALMDAAGAVLEAERAGLGQMRAHMDRLAQSPTGKGGVADAELQNRAAAYHEALGRLEDRTSVHRQLSLRMTEAAGQGRFDDHAKALASTIPAALGFAEAGETQTAQLALQYTCRLEAYARRIYATDPAAVPKPLRDRLEQVWAFDARHEISSIGGPVDPGCSYDIAQDPAVLLCLASSDLVGWDFHDGIQRLSVFIPVPALIENDWSRAWGAISN